MQILIDGYNLIFAASRRMGGFDISETEAARDKMLGLLARYKTVRSGRFLVFFDGGQESAHLPRRQFVRGMDVLFSDPGSDADSDIKNTVSHADNPRDTRVVSSDVAIQRFVKRYGAEVTESAAFLDEVSEALAESALPADEPIEKYEGPSKDEVDYWMNVFGEPEDEE